MSDKDSGAEIVRLFDPRQATHYAMPEPVQFELSQLFQALEAVADLADGQPGDQGADLEPRHYASIFRTFSHLGQRLLADAPAVDRTGRRLKGGY